MEFEEIYAKYVIRDLNNNMFVYHWDDRCVLRSMAGRFSKSGAISFIDKHRLENYAIEDAI